ncbi:MAG: hypothetical protein COB61_009240 [Thiotrichales bacterium]|nr:hypothetical protein [Thiotrichales bacterium]
MSLDNSLAAMMQTNATVKKIPHIVDLILIGIGSAQILRPSLINNTPQATIISVALKWFRLPLLTENKANISAPAMPANQK